MVYKVGIIGLGYVGLPLAVECGKKYATVGYDIDENRVAELRKGVDRTFEIEKSELLASSKLEFTSDSKLLASCNMYVVTVPTPVDNSKKPDLGPLRRAAELISKLLVKGDIVVFESTVYPGCTEEFCVPILERSGLEYNNDFFCGYSPERINPGDRAHNFNNTLKVTSGSTPEIAEKIDKFYASLVQAGTYRASSIKIAEAAKVIENSQRDINIAFVNELAVIFEKLEIDTLEVLAAAGTKWNFLPFKPGLVGGHCIGVDPYYLTQKAESVGYHPQVILSGRKINDQMGHFVAQRVIKLLGKKNKLSNSAKVLILGFTFKENCPDTRNTRVIDLYTELLSYGLTADIYDPLADNSQVKNEFGIQLISEVKLDYDAVILAVNHTNFNELDWELIRSKTSVIFDVKGALKKEIIDGRL